MHVSLGLLCATPRLGHARRFCAAGGVLGGKLICACGDSLLGHLLGTVWCFVQVERALVTCPFKLIYEIKIWFISHGGPI